jgi:hypothetical protein
MGVHVARGVDGVVTLDGETVVVRHVGSDRTRRRIAGRGAHHDQRSPVSEIVALHLHPATFWWNGHIRFVCAGEGDTATGPRNSWRNARGAVFDRNAVLFKRRRQREFEDLCRQIQWMIDTRG